MYMLSFYREAKHFFREAEYIVNSSKQGTFFFFNLKVLIFFIFLDEKTYMEKYEPRTPHSPIQYLKFSNRTAKALVRL